MDKQEIEQIKSKICDNCGHHSKLEMSYCKKCNTPFCLADTCAAEVNALQGVAQQFYDDNKHLMEELYIENYTSNESFVRAIYREKALIPLKNLRIRFEEQQELLDTLANNIEELDAKIEASADLNGTQNYKICTMMSEDFKRFHKHITEELKNSKNVDEKLLERYQDVKWINKDEAEKFSKSRTSTILLTMLAVAGFFLPILKVSREISGLPQNKFINIYELIKGMGSSNMKLGSLVALNLETLTIVSFVLAAVSFIVLFYKTKRIGAAVIAGLATITMAVTAVKYSAYLDSVFYVILGVLASALILNIVTMIIRHKRLQHYTAKTQEQV